MYNTFFNAVFAEISWSRLKIFSSYEQYRVWFIIDQIKKKSYCVCFNKFVDSHNNRWWIIFSMISLFINAILFFFLDENDSNVHLEIYCLWISKSIKFISNLYSCIFCYKLFDFLIALSNRAYYPIICKNGKKKVKRKPKRLYVPIATLVWNMYAKESRRDSFSSYKFLGKVHDASPPAR